MYAKILYTLFKADNDLSTLLTDGDGELRAYPIVFPQLSLYSGLVFQQINGEPTYTKPINKSKKDENHIQIDIYSKSYQNMVDIAQAVRNLLEGYRGVVDEKKVELIYMLQQKEDFDHENQFYRKIMDFEMQINF